MLKIQHPSLIIDYILAKVNNPDAFNYYPPVVQPCLASVVPVIHVALAVHVMDVAEIQTTFPSLGCSLPFLCSQITVFFLPLLRASQSILYHVRAHNNALNMPEILCPFNDFPD